MSFGRNKKGKNIKNNEKNTSIQRIYRLGSMRVHKCLHCPYMPEYGSTSQKLHVYVSICICESCKRCLLMEFSVTKLIGINFIVVLIFYSLNNVFVSP